MATDILPLSPHPGLRRPLRPKLTSKGLHTDAVYNTEHELLLLPISCDIFSVNTLEGAFKGTFYEDGVSE